MSEELDYSHGEFVEGYRAGTLRVLVDRKNAANFVSGRILLPFFLLPVFGLGVGLALMGHIIVGVFVFLTGIGFRFFVRSTSQGFVLLRALDNARFYKDAVAARAIRVEEVEQPVSP